MAHITALINSAVDGGTVSVRVTILGHVLGWFATVVRTAQPIVSLALCGFIE